MVVRRVRVARCIVMSRPTRVAVSLALVLALAACTHDGPSHSLPSDRPGISTPSEAPPSAATAAATPVLDRALFDEVNRAVVSAHAHPLGADFTAALHGAGFPKSAMQLTADRTSIGLEPGSIQFSVRVGDECFVGQYGTAVGGYRSETVAPLAGGGCLIGDTVPVH